MKEKERSVNEEMRTTSIRGVFFNGRCDKGKSQGSGAEREEAVRRRHVGCGSNRRKAVELQRNNSLDPGYRPKRLWKKGGERSREKKKPLYS